MKSGHKNINRRSDSASWDVYFYPPHNDGRPKKKSFADKKHGGRANAHKEAQKFLFNINSEIEKGKYIDPHKSNIPLAEFKYHYGITKRAHKENSISILENIWETYIAPYPIADKRINSVSPYDIKSHIVNLRSKDNEELSNSTITKVVEVLRVLLNKAVEMQFLANNPAKTSIVRDAIPPKNSTKHFYLEAEEVEKIYQKALEISPQYAVIFPLMAYTGFRIGEARGLLWSDIDFKKGLISITKTYNDDLRENTLPKTEESIREVSVDKFTLGLLKEHRQKYFQLDCPFVFANRGCTGAILRKNLSDRALKPILDELGMDKRISFHDFRHTSVALAKKSGSEAFAIGKRLGHKNIQEMYGTYSTLFREVDIDVVEKLEQYQKQKLG